jgi:hypothetical protein
MRTVGQTNSSSCFYLILVVVLRFLTIKKTVDFGLLYHFNLLGVSKHRSLRV